MGAQASKPEQQPKQQQQQPEKLTLTQSLVNKVSSEPQEKTAASNATTASSPSSSSSSSSPLDLLGPSRQSHLDSSVRSAISSELAKLRKQEAQVQSDIQSQLEKENLAVESKHTSASASGGSGRSSHALQKELDEVRRKISRHDEGRKKVENAPGVKEARSKVVQCYKDNQGRTLDCWQEAKEFTRAVEKAEKDFIASLSS